MRSGRVIVVAVAVLGLYASSMRGQVTVEQPFLGIKLYSINQTSPRPNNIRIAEIDLTNPSIRFRNSPRDPGLANGDETITQTTRQFVDEQSAQIGINTSFFRLDNGGAAVPTNNEGLLVSDGDKISPWDAANQVGINLSSANVASLVTAPSNRPTGFETTPTVALFNAVRGSNRLLDAAVNVAPPDSTTPGAFLNLNPRSAMGYTADNKLLLATIDGRRTGFSEGMYLREVADLLKSYGAVEAINLDGGGSSTMAIDYYGDGAIRSRLANTPSGSTERYVGASMGVYATRNPAYVPPTGLVTIPPPPGNIRILEDFEDGNGQFHNDPDFSGSNRGLLEITDGDGPSSAQRDANQHGRAFASQRISTISLDDPTWTGFRLRYLCGGGDPVNNEQLGAGGYVGFLMKTITPGLTASIGIDENLTRVLESSAPIDVISDGQWHLYQWNLADAAQWESFANGNGQIDGPITTVDSVIISSLIDQNSMFWLDALAYNPDGPLTALVPEPSTAVLLITSMFLAASCRHRR